MHWKQVLSCSNNVRWVFSSYQNRRRGVNLIHTGMFYSMAENFSFKVVLSAHITASGWPGQGAAVPSPPLFFAQFLVCGFGHGGRRNIFLFLPGAEQILVLKHSPGVFLFRGDPQLVFEQLETRRNALSAICFPIDGPTFAPQPCKDNANTAQQNMEQLIALYTVTLPITSFDSQLGWVLTWGATTFHWDLLLQVE